MNNRRISDIFPINQRVCFHSGNLIGHFGTVTNVENESKNPIAIYGFLITVKLDNSKIVFVEKTEHIHKVK